MRDGRAIAMLRGIVAELLTVTKLRLWLTVHTATRLGRLNDGRHVVGVSIDGHAAFDHGQRQALGLQITIIDAYQRGELGAGRMAHYEKTPRVTSVSSDMVMHPADRLRNVTHNCSHINIWQKTVIGRNKDKSFLHKDLWFDLDACLVASLPSSAMNPEHHGQVFRIRRRIHVEHVALMCWVGVRDVALDVLNLPFGQNRNGDNSTQEVRHGIHPYL